MQRRRLIELCLFLMGLVVSFSVGSVVWAYEGCPSYRPCGEPPNCTYEYCSGCTYGCSSDSCTGGTCNPAPSCSGSTPCGTWSTGCYARYCDDLNRCPWGCVRNTCSGGDCYEGEDCEGDTPCGTWPECSGVYCGSWCAFGCTSEGCFGGTCAGPQCESGDPKCENNVYSLCVDGVWVEQQTCGFGCDEDGLVCVQGEYCEDFDCDNCGDGWYEVICWADSTETPSEGYPRLQCVEGTSCEVGVCHPVSSTCGGTLTVERCEELYPGMGYISHIDNCGGQDCGPPCTGPGCIAEYPMKPTLLAPTDGGVTGTSVTLSWERNGWGVGCPENSNSQSLYLEAGDSSPDVEVGSLDASVSSYDASGLESGTVYYWRVRLNNGSLGMDSDVFSFNVNGLIEGYFFDSGGMIVCPADLSDPAYDSRKIGGGMLDITSGGDSYLDVTTIADGSYSQAVTIPSSYVLEEFRLGAGFVSTPDLICDGTSVEFVLGGDGVAVRSFGFLRDHDGWWQAVGGDVYGGMGMESAIPGSCTVGEGCQPYLIASDAGGESGLARYLSGSIDLGSNESASVGPDGWVANSGYAGQNANYAYYTSKMALLEKTSWGGSGKPVFNPEIGEDFEVYMYTGTATIDFDVAADEKMIFMVGGDVDVSSDIDVAEGGHLAVIASGSITFANDVSQVEGWWVGDSLNIESTGDEGTELQFRGEGSFIGWNGVSLNRDRGGSNATEPAEEFVFRPDLMINAPDALKFSRYVWQEKAP